MRVLFAVNNEKISESIIKKYQSDYKEIISAKNVYYFNAIIKELQRNRNYDRIIISEDLEPYSNRNYEMIDKFLFEKLDSISDEASNNTDTEIPIILICTDRREKGEPLLTKLFSIGIYSGLIGTDRTIENLCSLINKPRAKREAKAYYKIFSDETDYKAESSNEVNETEVQNIVNHFKKLGKNENAYVTSFNEVAAQYTNEQLKLIVGYLPLNVRAVLEEECQAYQNLMLASVKGKIKERKEKALTTKNINVPNKSSNNIDLINKALERPKMSKPVVIPSGINPNSVKKVFKQTNDEQGINERPTIISKIDIKGEEKVNSIQDNYKNDYLEDFEEEEINNTNNFNINSDKEEETDDIDLFNISSEQENEFDVSSNQNEIINDIDNINENIEEKEDINIGENIKKRGRGRPPKEKSPSELSEISNEPKRGRGRPRKVIPQSISDEENVIDSILNNNDDVNLFDLNEKSNNKQETQLEDVDLFNMPDDSEEENQNTSDFNLFDLDNDSTSEDSEFNLFDLSSEEENGTENNKNDQYENDFINNQEQSIINEPKPMQNQYTNINQMQNVNNSYDNGVSISNLLTSDKKVVGFVGTSKNGTSFLVNNVAALMASKGINTAILDLTKNKNAYYIYTQNDERLRTQSANCIEGLRRGNANGISAGKNLTVYTTLPNESDGIGDYSNILQTLVKNYSLVILDCDFDTDLNYFKEVQELYLVQTYDILTIQPLTAFVRELEDKNIISPNKLRVVVNKVLKVRNLNEKMIIGGISKYNSPDMTYQKDLFDINNIMYTVIPFEDQTYAKYLEGLVMCNISLNGYSRGLLDALEILGDMVYPLISRRQQYGSKNYNSYNSYGSRNMNTQSQFNSNIDSTLNKMRNNY